MYEDKIWAFDLINTVYRHRTPVTNCTLNSQLISYDRGATSLPLYLMHVLDSLAHHPPKAHPDDFVIVIAPSCTHESSEGG